MSISVSGASQQQLLVKLMRETAATTAAAKAAASSAASAAKADAAVPPVDAVDASTGFSVSPQVMAFLSRLQGMNAHDDYDDRRGSGASDRKSSFPGPTSHSVAGAKTSDQTAQQGVSPTQADALTSFSGTLAASSAMGAASGASRGERASAASSSAPKASDVAKMLLKLDAVLSAYAANSGPVNNAASSTFMLSV